MYAFDIFLLPFFFFAYYKLHSMRSSLIKFTINCTNKRKEKKKIKQKQTSKFLAQEKGKIEIEIVIQ